MSTTIIILLCLLVLLAYGFEVSYKWTRVPPVILLLLLGWGLGELAGVLDITIPDLSPALPVLGTIGLILIVLEGSLELKLEREKISLIIKAFVLAIVPVIFLAAGAAYIIAAETGTSIHSNLVNMLPLTVISSAIAIPTVAKFRGVVKETVSYESSISDVSGVILFNLVAASSSVTSDDIITAGIQLTVMIVLSFIATGLLAYLLSRLQHKIKYTPVIFLVILIYSLSKIYHLPALLFILIFGIFLGNLLLFRKWKLVRKLEPEILEKEVHKLNDLLSEGTFVIRALFFLIFGFVLDTDDIINLDSLPWAVGLSVTFMAFRGLLLKLLKVRLLPTIFVAPRGLITILLFLSVPEFHQIAFYSNSLVVQVILVTIFIMMIGIIITGGESESGRPVVLQQKPL